VLRFHTAGYLQFPNSASSENPAWSLTGRGSISRRFSLSPTVYTLPSVSAFGRLLSVESASAGVFDPDVFTAYKRDHRWGFVLADSLSYRPFLDTELRGTVSLASNEAFDADNAGVTVLCRQYFYGLELETHWRAAHYFADADRSQARTRQRLGCALLYDLWTGPQDRLEFSCSLDYDLSDRSAAGFLSVVWNIGNGRGYRDFIPGSVSFLDLREDRLPADYNNILKEQSRD
jgi:hypothetical protein